MKVKKIALVIFCCVSIFTTNLSATLYFEQGSNSHLIFTASMVCLGGAIGLSFGMLNSANTIANLRGKLGDKFISNYKNIVLEMCGKKKNRRGLWNGYLIFPL